MERIHSTWLCAPKAFRYIEKLIVEIGALGSSSGVSEAASILQCEDTYPDFEANQRHFRSLLGRLRGWLDGARESFASFGEPSPVKRWLVHLLWHKLVFHSRYEENFGKLVGERDHGRSGSKLPDDGLFV